MAGDKSFRYDLDVFINKFQSAGYEVCMFRSSQKGDMKYGLQNITEDEYHGIVVSGGDGTVNEVVNGMMKNNIQVPLGILPFGTANDFANHLNMPKDLESCCDVILRNNIHKVDIGQANEQYFINVCCGGLFTNVSQSIDMNIKNTLGKLGYYLKGIEQIPNFRPISLRMRTKSQTIEDQFYLFMVLNGKSAGGFDKLAKHAAIDDGVFDVLLFKARPLHEIAVLFVKLLRGEHLEDPNIIFLKEKEMMIECLEEDHTFYESDIDGEKGPDLPLQIQLHPKALQVFTNL